MEPYDDEHKCIKCTWEEVEWMYWSAQKEYSLYGIKVDERLEHIEITCKRCSYQWKMEPYKTEEECQSNF